MYLPLWPLRTHTLEKKQATIEVQLPWLRPPFFEETQATGRGFQEKGRCLTSYPRWVTRYMNEEAVLGVQQSWTCRWRQLQLPSNGNYVRNPKWELPRWAESIRRTVRDSNKVLFYVTKFEVVSYAIDNQNIINTLHIFFYVRQIVQLFFQNAITKITC